MYDNLEAVCQAIMNDAENIAFTQQGILPLFMAPPTAKILLIGQAPGLKSQTGMLAFMDKSGERLREWMGIDEKIFYHSGHIAVLPMDYYFPGKSKSGDLPPRKHIAKKWHPEMLKFLPNIKLTLLVGSYSQRYYLKQASHVTLTDNVREFRQFLPQYFPLPHPSPRNQLWQAKNPWFETDVLPVLKEEVAAILKTAYRGN